MATIKHASDRLLSRHEDDAGFTVWPVDMDAIKDRSQVWHDADDPVLDADRQGIIAEAVDMIETECDVALITQSREIVWATVPTLYQFPVFPVQTIESIEYTDVDGDTQTAVDPIVTIIGYSKPPTFSQYALTMCKPIKVTYTAGFGDSPEYVPPRYTRLIQQVASHLWNHRDPSTDASKKFRDWLDREIHAAGAMTRYA